MENKQNANLLRCSMYHYFSLFFHYPHSDTWNLLKSGLFDETLKMWNSCQVFQPLQMEFVTDSFENEEQFQKEYQVVFGHTISSEYPPYETQYSPAHIFMQTQELGDIAGFYKAFGLSSSENEKERPDHISVEMEFMSFLVYKESFASANHKEEQVQLCRKAQAKFTEDHIGRWAPIFASSLAEKTKGFYSELANLLYLFIQAESNYLGVKPQIVRNLDTISYTPEVEDCSSCGESDSCGLTFKGPEV